MGDSSEILAAIKAMQIQLEGQIHATNTTFRELAQSVDARFAALQHNPTGNPFGRPFHPNGNPGNNEISPVLRSMKMDVPRFDGTDPHGWIFRVEEFFDFHSTPDHMRLRIVAFHMEGRAASWFQWMKANNLLSTWPEFISSLKNRFGSSPYTDPQGMLSKLTQTSTVAEFQSAFEELMNQVTGISEPLLISFFITGLRADIRRELSFARPLSLMEAFALARAHEARLNEAKTDLKLSPRWNQRGSGPPSPSSSGGSNTSTNSTFGSQPQHNVAIQVPTSPSIAPTLPIKRLSHAEIIDKRERGLCYNCDEKWSPNHRCKGKYLLLFGNDEDGAVTNPEQTQEESMETELIGGDISSLRSFVGGSKPRSLRLTGHVGFTDIQVLIDSGSTHNFIRLDLAEKLNLPMQEIQPFRVFLGNGDYLTCQMICLQVKLLLQGHPFSIDLHVLPIEGLGVVLGIQWLQSLGRIMNDYTKLQMEFSWEGKKIQLKGEDHVVAETVTMHQLQALVGEDEVVQFSHVSQTPTSLPPLETNDHRSQWLPDFPADNAKLYPYPHMLKQSMTQFVGELLQQMLFWPSQALNERTPSTVTGNVPATTEIQALKELLLERDILLETLKANLLQAHNRMRQVANRKRRDVAFQLGEMVLVKLSKHYHGPFPIVEMIGEVAYRLQLSEGSIFHRVFHISELKPFSSEARDTGSVPLNLPQDTQGSQLAPKPIAMCAARNIIRQGGICKQALIQWEGEHLENSTWEDRDCLLQDYPLAHLEDKVVFEGEGDDTTEVVGHKWDKAQKEKTKAQTQEMGRPKRENRILY